MKTIVTAATYRQSSRVTPELLQKDPDNRLLARGPRFRLGPEVIRDQALAVSGLLVEKVGGPSVKPYQPAGLWQELVGRQRATCRTRATDLYRRSLYTYWKRTVPPPFMVNFDSPNREQCAVSESRTNTPLQALNLMNDVTFVEAARKLGRAHDGRRRRDRARSRIAYGFRLVLAPRAAIRASRGRCERASSGFRRLSRRRRTRPRVPEARAIRPYATRARPGELAAYASVASLHPEPGRDDHEGISMNGMTTAALLRPDSHVASACGAGRL